MKEEEDHFVAIIPLKWSAFLLLRLGLSTKSTPQKFSTIAVIVPVPEPTEDPFRRTIILLRRVTVEGEDLYFRGNSPTGKECKEDEVCGIPIRVRSKSSDDSDTGVEYLRWGGYGNNKGIKARWTTNYRRSDTYSQLNLWGSHYWLLDMDMDCSKTMNGVFAFKYVISRDKFSTWVQWEPDVSTYGRLCNGTDTGLGQPINHLAVCGKVNVYHGYKHCEMYSFPDDRK